MRVLQVVTSYCTHSKYNTQKDAVPLALSSLASVCLCWAC
ncbi:hypothetical protein T06_16529 [Trichinella sp. T6]|nr:hypothetical protein T06_16529 [Trichinella sp. T6]